MAIAHNISRNVEHHVFQPSLRFWVQATQDIQGRKRIINQGDYVLIDPNATPKDGSLVLIGNTLKQWHGQECVDGCAQGSFIPEGIAIQISSDVV